MEIKELSLIENLSENGKESSAMDSIIGGHNTGIINVTTLLIPPIPAIPPIPPIPITQPPQIQKRRVPSDPPKPPLFP